MSPEAIEAVKDDIRGLFYELFAKIEPIMNGLAQVNCGQYQDRLEALLDRIDKKEEILPEDYMDDFTDLGQIE